MYISMVCFSPVGHDVWLTFRALALCPSSSWVDKLHIKGQKYMIKLEATLGIFISLERKMLG